MRIPKYGLTTFFTENLTWAYDCDCLIFAATFYVNLEYFIIFIARGKNQGHLHKIMRKSAL